MAPHIFRIIVIHIFLSLFSHYILRSCCRPQLSPGKGEASLSSSSQSVRDGLRQRYSVTWHPRLLYLIVSDGYMATVMRVLGKPSAALLLKDLLKNTTQDLEKASGKLEKSQVKNQDFVKMISVMQLLPPVEKNPHFLMFLISRVV